MNIKFLVALCAVAAVAQAINVDWTKVKTIDILPKKTPGILGKSSRGQKLLESRITGGEEATYGESPYICLGLFKVQGGTASCGASLLSTKWSLTAAHCAKPATAVTIICGIHNITANNEPGRVVVPVAETRTHERYNEMTLANDIALLKLSFELTFNDYVQAISLPWSQKHNTFAGSNGTVTGWGRDSDSATGISPVLREATDKLLSNSECANWWETLITPSKICLNGIEGRSACNGDSGGPCTVIGSDGKRMQVGIVSFGSPKGCQSGNPSVYTRTTSYLDWITTNTGISANSED